ncbi:hypothetical protein QBC37DRAFT_171006 [Rhypophila decipiens]|uniref:PARP-type domain-containing protein n=1 Tax=Rhypophila decipiens TaxID=261697 RepID=A0AAN7B5K6_9PEZI|nr:hypothetical protein QBC37DRAFT_171006 [Rhypophila decipiens]
MPRNHIKDDDLDFKIFVDPSCLGDPVEDTEPSASTNNDISAQPSMATDQLPDAALPDSESVKETSAVTVDDIDVPQEQKVEDVMVDKEEEVTPAAQAEDSAIVEEQQEDAPAEPTEETSHDSAAPEEADSAPSVQDQDQPTAEAEPEHKEEEQEQAGSQLDNDKQEEPSAPEHISIVESEAAAEQQDAVEEEQETEDVDKVTEEPQPKEQDVSLREEESHLDDEANHPEQQDEHVEITDETETQDLNDATDHVVRSVSSQSFTDRKTSLRTEALIQAAARAVVAKLERRKASGDSMQPEDEPEDVEHSILSTATEEGDTLLQYDGEETTSRRQSTNSTGSQLHHDVPSGDEGGESSSHHEPESDDVFSDRSARSSMASFDNNPPPAEEEDLTIKSPSVQHDLDQADRHSVRSTNTNTRSPRVSGVSMISDLSQYDKEDFVPTSREARLPFRTPSAIRNIQMSSPTPSVIHGVSPRSSKRCQNGGGGLPTISRLGSPTVTTTAQFSPKSRSTPTRLKPRREAPLVLLHVTVLPLRWMWGDILNCLDALDGKTYGETKETFQASEQLRSLRDSWRELQDHVTDTVLERGVLMPHPQDDFEVLEERFLDSLELPLRRRARIMECGHYLGPSNEFGPDEEGFVEESEDEYAEEKRHWCNTCRNEIRYEDLGPGKVFRVKVYASNGLMRAGAWEACWKEMERVDIEVEPIVEMSVQNELEKLVVINGELEEQRQREMEQAEAEAAAAQAARDEEVRLSVLAQSRPQSVAMLVQESVFNDEQAALPASRSLMDTPTTQDQQVRSSAMMISSPAAASMQMMHASPAQPPSTMASMRFASPSPQPSQSSPLRHAILPPEDPIPEEPPVRYGDTPQQSPLPLEPAHVDSQEIYPASSMSTSMPIMTRHADPYIPPSPRSPSEEAYVRRHRRTSSSRGRSTHSHQSHSHSQKHDYPVRGPQSLENASFIELLLEAFKVLLRDPKNVAIIVLCLFLMAILVRPSASSSAAQNGLQLVPRADMNGDGNEQLVGGYRYEAKAVEPVVQVESVVVPEVASVLVVTTTVTSTPAEASIDVEVAVAAETEVVGVDDIESGSAEEAAVMAEETAQDIIASDSALESVGNPLVEAADNVEESLDSLSAAPGNATVSVLAEEDQAKAEGTNQTEASIPVLAELNQELPSLLNMTDTTDLPEPAEEEEEEEEAASTIAPVEELAPPIVAQEEVFLIGPQNIETSTASTSETETATAAQEPNVVATATPSMSAGATNGTDPCQSIISQKTTLRIIETITETVTVSAVVASTATSSETTKVTSEAESKSASESESTAEVKPASTTATEQVATVSAPASVSESVSSMLETTTTVAPSLTTVQETVYETETETVRVTVSVGGSTSRQRHDEL